MFRKLFKKLKDNISAGLSIAHLTTAPPDQIILTAGGYQMKARHYRAYHINQIYNEGMSQFAGAAKCLEMWNELQAIFNEKPAQTLAALAILDAKIQLFLITNPNHLQYYLGNSLDDAISQSNSNSTSSSTFGNLSNQQIIDNNMPDVNYDYD